MIKWLLIFFIVRKDFSILFIPFDSSNDERIYALKVHPFSFDYTIHINYIVAWAPK